MKHLAQYIRLFENFQHKEIKPIQLKKENKKAALCCFGRCALDATNCRSVSLSVLPDLLKNNYGRTVEYVSHPVKTDKERENYKDIADTDLNNYDEVWVYMSPQNVFGGVFDNEMIQLFEKIGKFKGKLYGIVNDPKIPPTSFGDFMHNRVKRGCLKSDNGNYRGVTDAAVKAFNKVWNDMTIAFGGLNYNKYFNEFEDKRDKEEDDDHSFSLPVNSNGEYSWFHIPLSEYQIKNDCYDLKTKQYEDKRKYDLVYFGNNRGNQRNKQIVDLYDQKGLSNQLIGLDLEFNNCKCDKHPDYVKHDELYPMVCNSYATVIMGDPLHNDNFITSRFCEALLLDVVAFISEEYDPEKKLIQNKELQDFIYVKDGNELKQKINKIKTDKKLFRHIIDLERKEINRIYNEAIK